MVLPVLTQGVLPQLTPVSPAQKGLAGMRKKARTDNNLNHQMDRYDKIIRNVGRKRDNMTTLENSVSSIAFEPIRELHSPERQLELTDDTFDI